MLNGLRVQSAQGGKKQKKSIAVAKFSVYFALETAEEDGRRRATAAVDPRKCTEVVSYAEKWAVEAGGGK